jgi:nuclear transport factor 2 (NTF2) superfamily protein
VEESPEFVSGRKEIGVSLARKWQELDHRLVKELWSSTAIKLPSSGRWLRWVNEVVFGSAAALLVSRTMAKI